MSILELGVVEAFGLRLRKCAQVSGYISAHMRVSAARVVGSGAARRTARRHQVIASATDAMGGVQLRDLSA